jgi:hypothetical protein
MEAIIFIDIMYVITNSAGKEKDGMKLVVYIFWSLVDRVSSPCIIIIIMMSNAQSFIINIQKW